MELICIISEKSEIRSIDGARGKIDVVDVVLKSGCDCIKASAFDETAKSIADGTVKEGALYRANVTFTIRQTEKGSFQSARIDKMDLLYEYIPTF